MGLFHLGMVEQGARVKQSRLDVLFAELGKASNDIVPRLSAGDLV